MLIGIDGNEANIKKRVGVGRYAFEIISNLKSQISNLKFKELNFKIYLKNPPLKDLPYETTWWKYRVIGPKSYWTQIALPVDLYLKKPRPDVFFSPTHYAPRFSPCPCVVSIMDLSFIHFPEMFKRRDLWQLKSWTSYSLKRAKKIITISRSSKNDIIEYYNVKPSKINVIYPGVIRDEKLKMKREKLQIKIKNIQKKFGIEENYILYVGTLQPRKNLVRLIEAFNKLICIDLSKNSKKFENLNLVIVGKKGWMYEEIFKRVKKLGLTDKVIFTGYVPDEDLPYIYKGAECFVLVSLYEGFGFPVLEALGYGVPVVVSNVSSLPEIVDEAGILVDPYDVDDIARGISEALHFDTIKYRSRVKRGLEQAKKFSWKKCARETLRVLEEAAGLKS